MTDQVYHDSSAACAGNDEESGKYFAKLFNRVIDEYFADMSAHDFKVYGYLLRHCGLDGQCFKAVTTISESCCMSRTTVMAALKSLEGLTLIAIKRGGCTKEGKKEVNYYHLLPVQRRSTGTANGPVQEMDRSEAHGNVSTGTANGPVIPLPVQEMDRSEELPVQQMDTTGTANVPVTARPVQQMDTTGTGGGLYIDTQTVTESNKTPTALDTKLGDTDTTDTDPRSTVEDSTGLDDFLAEVEEMLGDDQPVRDPEDCQAIVAPPQPIAATPSPTIADHCPQPPAPVTPAGLNNTGPGWDAACTKVIGGWMIEHKLIESTGTRGKMMEHAELWGRLGRAVTPLPGDDIRKCLPKWLDESGWAKSLSPAAGVRLPISVASTRLKEDITMIEAGGKSASIKVGVFATGGNVYNPNADPALEPHRLIDAETAKIASLRRRLANSDPSLSQEQADEQITACQARIAQIRAENGMKPSNEAESLATGKSLREEVAKRMGALS